MEATVPLGALAAAVKETERGIDRTPFCAPQTSTLNSDVTIPKSTRKLKVMIWIEFWVVGCGVVWCGVVWCGGTGVMSCTSQLISTVLVLLREQVGPLKNVKTSHFKFQISHFKLLVSNGKIPDFIFTVLVLLCARRRVRS